MIIFNNNVEYNGDVYPENNRIILNVFIDSSDDLESVFSFLSTANNLQYIQYKDEVYLNYTKILSINTIMNRNSITKLMVTLEQVGITVEQYNAILTQIEELESCILEMSEVLYGDDNSVDSVDETTNDESLNNVFVDEGESE